jgi:GH15 family glucan-1,4-alpha-glucosidase
MANRDAEIIREFQQPSGAYPASPLFVPYQHTWFRDGSYIADAMSQSGNVTSAKSFFSWCARVIGDRKDTILAGGRLDARYTYEGKEVPGEWGSYQLDGFGLFLWALKRHEQRHGVSLDAYAEAIELTQEYLARHFEDDCFDWWEEREGRHATTLACIYAGLHAFGNPAAQQVKALIDVAEERIDGSLLAVALLEVVPVETFQPVLERIERELKEPDGGVHRYTDDSYYGGGEWPVLAAMLGVYYADLGRMDDARMQLAWCDVQRNKNGWMPEQSIEHARDREAYEEWASKHGEPALPLLWSHAMVMSLRTRLEGTA